MHFYPHRPRLCRCSARYSVKDLLTGRLSDIRTAPMPRVCWVFADRRDILRETPARPCRRGARRATGAGSRERPGGDEWQAERLLERPSMGVVGLITGDELQQDCTALLVHPSGALDRRDDLVWLLNPLRISAQGTA